MLSRFVSALAIVVATATPIFAQARVEVSGFGGWTFSDGVSGTAVLALDGNVYDRIDPKDGGSFGLGVGIFTTEHVEFGFLYNYQFSKLLAGGTNEREIGDLSVSGYHGYFGYNWGDADAVVRPYVFGGLGATSFSSVDFAVAGRVGTISGESQFSTTWGAGVKAYPSQHFGVRAGIQFTPTYIKTDPGGWWCDPYWGCYLVGNAQYSNQWDLSGGITVRF